MSLNELIFLTIFLPLFGALATGLFVRRVGDTRAQLLTCIPMVLAALFATLVFSRVALGHAEANVVLAPWIVSGDFAMNWSLKVDALTSVMLVLVTWVSAIVHIYSVGYMSHDDHKPRFMAYLSLFTFSMLMLVTADNLIQLFFGWEGVGLCSYLLIGFWFKKESASGAAMKAFLVNRVGDFGFALGIAALFFTFGTVEFAKIFPAAAAFHADTPEASWLILGFQFPVLDTICLLLFMGAMGKSAQFLLHTWLPDAMEGPTPVSALIHAATMVTAGVFMLARMSPLFELAPTALMVVTYVGAITALFAASVGLVQNDIKRVIAYSTCSQLGYMFFACGVSAYGAGVFHLFTHGFFKALLFLCAGSVIHAMSGEQDMRKMGGIWRMVPYTYAFMWIGSLALAGIPYFAGYFSKDMILEAAYAAGSTQGYAAYWMGLAAAFMTAFYSWRLLFMTFHGKPRADKHTMDHVHESPRIMLLPLVPLVAGALFVGALGYYSWGMVDGHQHHGYYDFWGSAILVLEQNNTLERAHHVPGWVPVLPLFVVLSGIALAWLFYIRRPELPGQLAGRVGGLYRFLLNKWYFDELYDRIFVRPSIVLGRFLWQRGDVQVIDGMGPNGVAAISRVIAKRTGQVQTGYVYHYAFAMLVGVVALISWLVYVMLG
ncbi:MAG: NADH-quinone oxidoreductase subunit L [Azospirillum brasilense]|nr:MAG: NADH-quinone oxidoreductase subunit L [Azospirillum brasilense]